MNDKPATQTLFQVTDDAASASGPPVGFFAIGVLINVVLLAAYGIWAYRQWKKSDRHDD